MTKYLPRSKKGRAVVLALLAFHLWLIPGIPKVIEYEQSKPRTTWGMQAIAEDLETSGDAWSRSGTAAHDIVDMVRP